MVEAVFGRRVACYFPILYPAASARVLVTDRHLDLVDDEVDISLRVGRQPESSLVFRRLIRFRHILVAAPSYLANAGRLSHPADLRNHRLLGFSKWFDNVSWKLPDGHVTERTPVKLSLGINDYAGVIRPAVSGMGVAEMPSIICGRELRQELLVPVIPQWQFEEVDLSAYYLTRRYPSRVVELFLDHCAQNAEAVLLPRFRARRRPAEREAAGSDGRQLPTNGRYEGGPAG